MRTRLFRTLDLIMDLGAFLAGAFIILTMFMICVKVMMRYLFGYGIIGIDQLTGTLMVYTTFFGAAWVLRQDRHVTIDIVLNAVGPKVRSGLLAVTSMLGAAVCLVLVVYGTLEVVESLSRGYRVAAELEIPRAVNLWVIPAGSLLLFIQFLRRAQHYFSEIMNAR